MIKDKSIFIKNIYYMLSYAFTTLNQGGYEDVATEEFENMHNLFAAILAKGISRQLKQGLYREYLNRKEDVAVVRGKIDMPGTIQNRLARKRVLTCEYDELSENNLLNQILKTTVMLLLRHTRVDQEYKSDLKKEMLFFSNVDTIDPTTIRWSAIRFQRNNNTYRMLISLCQLILEGMLLTTDSGEYKLASFVDEQRMNRLYEKFILEYYAKECPQVTATASQIPWALDDGIGTMLPVMQSDIMLTSGSEVLIIDAKVLVAFFGHIDFIEEVTLCVSIDGGLRSDRILLTDHIEDEVIFSSGELEQAALRILEILHTFKFRAPFQGGIINR